MDPVDLSQSYALVLGALFVLAHAYDRFNNPRTIRASTTAFRYHSAAAIYILIYFVIYYLLTRYPVLIQTLGGTETTAGGVQKLLENSPPLLSALLLTILLQKGPLASFDRWLRNRMKSIALILYEAHRLSREIRERARFDPSEDLQKRVRQSMVARGFPGEAIDFDGSNNLESQWTKTSTMMVQLASWEAERKFARCFEEGAQVWQSLREQDNRLADKALKVRRICNEVGTTTQDDKVQQFVADYASELRDQIKEHQKDVADFASQIVLKCGLTNGARWHVIGQMGFTRPTGSTRPRLTVNEMLQLMFLLVILVPINLLLFNPSASRENIDIGQTVLLVSMIVVIYSGAVLCAIFPRGKWDFAERDEKQTRPMLFYLTASALAVLLAAIVSFSFNTLRGYLDPQIDTLGGGLNSAWMAFTTRTYPYLLLSFATAFITAWHTDNEATRFSGSTLRLVEGLTQGGLTALAAYVVSVWISIVAPEQPVDPIRLTITSGLIGLVIGLMVPHWYRTAPKALEDVGEEPSPLASTGLSPAPSPAG